MISTLALNMVVHDEAHRIAATLEHVLPLVDEAVVVDQSSTDGTRDVLASYGVTVLDDVCHGYCEPSRQAALDATASEWVLVLDADEEPSEDFIAELRTLDRYPQFRVRIGLAVAGETFVIGKSVFRMFRKRDFYCKPVLHSCPLPHEPLTPSMGLVVLPYVAIWNTKSWEEMLEDDERYERLGRGDIPWLHLARARGVSGAELDAMTLDERHSLGFAPGGVHAAA